MNFSGSQIPQNRSLQFLTNMTALSAMMQMQCENPPIKVQILGKERR